MGGKTSAAAKNRYNEKAYDRIALVVVKGRKDEIRAAADKAGLSLNAYIVKAIEQLMSEDASQSSGE